MHPYVAFDYERFREQVDRQDDGTPLSNDDKLQLLKFNYGADFQIEPAVHRGWGASTAFARTIPAAGYDRYWRYGLRGAADLNLVGDVRLTVGGHFWTREYDDRIDVDNVGPNRYRHGARALPEGPTLSWPGSSGEFFAVVARYSYTRRTSDVDMAGYAVNGSDSVPGDRLVMSAKPGTRTGFPQLGVHDDYGGRAPGGRARCAYGIISSGYEEQLERRLKTYAASSAATRLARRAVGYRGNGRRAGRALPQALMALQKTAACVALPSSTRRHPDSGHPGSRLRQP